MKLKYSVAMIAVVIVALLSRCNKSDDYVNAIPSQAAFVARIDVKSIVKKADIDDKTRKQLAEKSAVLMGGRENPVGKLVSSLVDNPKSSGIDVTKDFYFFAENNYSALLAKVDDSDGLDALFGKMAEQHLCSKPDKKDGITYIEYSDGIAAYNDDAFVGVMGNTGRQRVMMFLNQTKNESFAASDYFKHILKSDDDIAFWYSAEIMPSVSKSLLAASIAPDKPIDWKKVSYSGSVTFGDGQMELNVSDSSTDPNYIEIRKMQDAVLKSIDGNLAGRISRDALAWGMFSIDHQYIGDWMKWLSGLKEMLQDTGLPIDFNTLLNDIDGDVAIAFNGMLPSLSGLTCYAQMPGRNFLNQLDRLIVTTDMSMSPIKLRKEGTDAYILTIEPVGGFMDALQTYYLGVDNGVFYFTGNKDLTTGKGIKNTVADMPEIKSIKGSKTYVQLNIGMVTSVFLSMGQTYMNIFDALTIESPEAGTLSVRLTLKDGKTNFLHQLLGVAVQL